MSRKKNFTAKLWKDAPLQEKHDAAIYGDSRSVETMQIVEGWGNDVVFYDEGGGDRMAAMGAPADKALARKNRKRTSGLILAHLEKELTKAYNSGDGSFFTKLAADFKSHKNPAEPVRAWLCGDMSIHKDGHGTLKELHHFAECWLNRVGKIDRDWFAKVVKEVGYPTKPDRVGRPRKNSVNSRRRQT